MRPLVAVEGSQATFGRIAAGLRRAGWTVVDGFTVAVADPPRPVVCAGVVDDAVAATEAVLAALAGHGLGVHATAPRKVLDLLYEDLQHIGPLELHAADDSVEHGHPRLSPDQQELLRLLLAGQTMAAAATRLAMSRRTADRRIAAARRAYGVASTAQLLRVASADL